MESPPSVDSCGLCRKPYRDPRLLPCLHAFCLDCLQKQLDDSTEQQAILPCTTCFEEIPRPIQDLPRHVYLSNKGNAVRRLSEIKTTVDCENCKSEEKACAFCHDCGDSGLRICPRCVEFHKEFRAFKTHTVVSLDSDMKEVVRKAYEEESRICTKHNDEVLKYFCKCCEALVCNECILFDHSGHLYHVMQSALKEQKTEVQSASSALEQALPLLAQAGSELKYSTTIVDECNIEIRREIGEAFAAIIAAVEKRKHELLVEAEAMAVVKKTRLQMQQEDLEKLNAAIRLALDTIQHATQSYSPVEFLSIKAVLKQSCLNLGKRFAEASLTPVTSPSMVASVSTVDVITAISSVGSVEEMLPCSPSLSDLVGINTKFPIGITKDAKRTLILQTRNSRGEPMDTGRVSIRAWLTDQSGKRICNAEVSYSTSGKYSVSFCVKVECSAKAHFTVNGNHIHGSPCDVMVRDYSQVKEPVLSFSTPSKPVYLYVSRTDGDIFVMLEYGDVSVYSKEGILKSTISGASLGIKWGRGIVVDEEGEVMYIACAQSHKIVKARIDGKLISSVGSRGTGHLQFDNPMGLYQDTSNNVYVADQNNHRVQVLGPDLVFKNELKCHDRVWGMAIDSLGNVHMATESGMKIFAGMIDYGGKIPCGDIVFGQEDYRFVTCCQSYGHIKILKQDNSLLGTVRGLSCPIGVCLDQSGFIYTAEFSANKVHKY